MRYSVLEEVQDFQVVGLSEGATKVPNSTGDLPIVPKFMGNDYSGQLTVPFTQSSFSTMFLSEMGRIRNSIESQHVFQRQKYQKKQEIAEEKLKLKTEEALEKREIAQLEKFQETMSDLMLAAATIVCVCLVLGAYGGWYSRLKTKLHVCTSYQMIDFRLFNIIFSPFIKEMNNGARWIACHMTIAGSAVVACLLFASCSYLALKGKSQSIYKNPLCSIGLYMGLLCGLCGFLAIASAGGNPLPYVFWWGLLCACHGIAATYPEYFFPLIFGHELTDNSQSRESKKGYKQQSLVWITTLSLSIFIPAMAGFLPFMSFRQVLTSIPRGLILAFA